MFQWEYFSKNISVGTFRWECFCVDVSADFFLLQKEYFSMAILVHGNVSV